MSSNKHGLLSLLHRRGAILLHAALLPRPPHRCVGVELGHARHRAAEAALDRLKRMRPDAAARVELRCEDLLEYLGAAAGTAGGASGGGAKGLSAVTAVYFMNQDMPRRVSHAVWARLQALAEARPMGARPITIAAMHGVGAPPTAALVASVDTRQTWAGRQAVPVRIYRLAAGARSSATSS